MVGVVMTLSGMCKSEHARFISARYIMNLATECSEKSFAWCFNKTKAYNLGFVQVLKSKGSDTLQLNSEVYLHRVGVFPPKRFCFPPRIYSKIYKTIIITR